FKKLDEDFTQSGISFKKLDENAPLEPIDRITPIKKKISQVYDHKVKGSIVKINQFIGKGKTWTKDKITAVKGLDPKKLLFLKIGVVGCIFIIVFGMVGITVYRNSEHRAFAIAARYEGQEDYESAIETYKQILETNPESIRAKKGLGFLYLDHLKDLSRAEGYLREVALLSEDPDVQRRMQDIFPVITVSPQEDNTIYTDLIDVELSTTASGATIIYTIENSDGKTPFTEYRHPITLKDGENIIAAKGISSYGFESDTYRFHFTVDMEDKFVSFNNIALENAMKEAMGKQSSYQLKESDMNSIYTMQILGDSIIINEAIAAIEGLDEAKRTWGNWGDLRDLGKLKNLKELAIHFQEGGSDFDFIASISSLEHLTINDANINHVEFIRNNTGLTYLDLSYNEIESLNGIQGLSNLAYLDLKENRIRDVYHISNLTTLKNLYIMGNPVEDVGILRTLEGLESFSFATNSKTEYDFLANMKELTKLDLGNYSANRIAAGADGRDLAALSQLTSLEYLSLAGTGVRDVTALSSLQNLQFLDLSNNEVNAEGMVTIGKLANLATLNLKGNQIDDGLANLANLGELKHLNLSLNNGIEDFSGLAFCTKLETLVMKSVRLSDFHSIASLGELKYLDLENNQLENVVFVNTPKLEYVNLGRNNINKMPNIDNLSSIEVMLLKNNPITDITALATAGDSSLVLLDISNARIEDAAAFANMTELAFLNISGNNQMVNMSAFDNMQDVKIIPVNATEEVIPKVDDSDLTFNLLRK
ncbi:MAG: leucine-rich repeat domain-containing protein, partial [Clostridiaceae bacterium]|nr:leucine-rich repeat domain-containing protein [Clostridiaceae bacterium]